MIWSTRLVSLLALAVSLPLAGAKDDVWDPKILYPNRDTLWRPGERHTVTWDISNPPPLTQHPVGRIYLLLDSRVLTGLGPLADNIRLQDGHVEITVPDVTLGIRRYQLVLYGDSENQSEPFTILWQ